MRGKWAAGIEPRNFSWVIKEQLAVSERPGGYARNHRRVRRQEEIIWLREQGFTLVLSLLSSTHNLHAYEELGMRSAHMPFRPSDDLRSYLPQVYAALHGWLKGGEKVLVHQEELGDRLMGVMAGYLLWAGILNQAPQAIEVVERLVHRQMGPPGRELVALAPSL